MNYFVNLYFFLGDEAGTWFVDLKNGNGLTGKGEPTHPADATLTMDSANFFAMFSGKVFIMTNYRFSLN